MGLNEIYKLHSTEEIHGPLFARKGGLFLCSFAKRKFEMSKAANIIESITAQL